MAEEGEAVVVMVGEEAEAAGAPMARFSMDYTAKTSKTASTQVRCNRWVLKGTST